MKKFITLFILVVFVIIAILIIGKEKMSKPEYDPPKKSDVVVRVCEEGNRRLTGDSVYECIGGEWEYVGLSSEAKG